MGKRGLASVFNGAVHKAPFNVNQYSYDDALKLYDGLRARGYPDHVAAGVAGNVMVENGGAGRFDTQRHQEGGGGGYGLFQLTNPTRKHEYQQFIQKNHLDPREMNTALDFHDHELKGGAYNGYYGKKAYDPLMKTKNVDEAALSYMRNFESPRARSAHADQRVALANEVFNRAQSRQNSAPSNQSAGYDAMELRGERGPPSAIGDDLGGAPFQRQGSAQQGVPQFAQNNSQPQTNIGNGAQAFRQQYALQDRYPLTPLSDYDPSKIQRTMSADNRRYVTGPQSQPQQAQTQQAQISPRERMDQQWEQRPQYDYAHAGSQTAQPVVAPPKPDINNMQFAEGVHAPEPSQKLYAALYEAPQQGGGTVMNRAPEPQIPVQDFAGSGTPNDLGINNTMQQNNFADMNGFMMQPGSSLPSFAMGNGFDGGMLPATDLQPGAGDYGVTDFGGSGFAGGDFGGLASVFG